jgi:hypothetical protein
MSSVIGLSEVESGEKFPFIYGDVYKIDFQPSAKFVNTVLTTIMKLETAILRRSPIGTSVLGAFQKKP